MLTKRDLELIDNLMKKRFIEFYDTFFEPFTTKSEERHIENKQQHSEIVVEVKKLKKEVHLLQEETVEISEYIKDHEKRIRKLEVVNNLS